MNNVNELYCRMKLNSINHSDNTFDKNIKFVVEKYVGDDIPKQINCNSLQDAITNAYKLFLSDELHSIGIYDKEGNYNGTNALNLFTDDNNIYNNEIKINELEKEIGMYKEFMKQYKAEKLFQEFKTNHK